MKFYEYFRDVVFKSTFIQIFHTFCFVFIALLVQSQSYVTEHIISVDSSFVPTELYTVDDISWITGYWVGEGLGGQVEEIWSEPKNGRMICSFRFDLEGSLVFSEHVVMTNTEQGISMLVKHFSADFEAWEDKSDYVDFPIINIDGMTAYLDGCTITRKADHLNIYVLIEHDGISTEELFSYKLRSD